VAISNPALFKWDTVSDQSYLRRIDLLIIKPDVCYWPDVIEPNLEAD